VYDPLGRVQLVCAPLATACALQPGPTPQAAVDPRHTIVMHWDSLSRRVRIADPDRGVERFRFDGAGNQTHHTNARLAVIESSYDALGRLVRMRQTSAGSTDPIDVELRYGDQEPSPPAHARGRIVAVHENALERSFAYDALGRTIRVDTRFADSSRTWTTHHHYDLLGRETSRTHPDGEVIASRFDAMGLERIASPQRVYVADLRHDAEGRARTVVYGNGDVRTLQYHPTSGHLSSLAARRSGAATDFQRLGFTWDTAGRVIAISDAVLASESLANVRYDGLSRILEATRNGQTLRFDYDALGNLIRHEGSTQPFEHASKPHALHDAALPLRFQYDASGNLVVRDGAALVYDALGRLVEHRAPGALPSYYAYDRTGERVRAARGADVSHFLGPDYEIKNGRRFVKTIRAEGMVVAQVSGPLPSQGAAAPWLVQRGPLDPAAVAGGVAALGMIGVLGFALARGRAPAWRRSVAGGLAVAILAAPATPALARKGDVRADDALTLADPLLVLRSLAGQSTLTPTQRADADVAPLAAGEPAGDQRVDAADAQALLRAATGADVDGDGLDGARETESGTWPLDRDSDGDGVADGDEDADADGVSNLAEIAAGTRIGDADSDADGYVDGDDPQPLVAEGVLVAYVHADHLGSSAVLTDASGLVVRRTRYALFGRVRSNAIEPGAPAATLDPAPKYTGQLLDADTGLHYFGARWYDARFARFVSPDTIVPDALDPQMLNRYAYVRNDPLARIDPSGHDPLWSYGVGDLAVESWDFYDDADADFGDAGYDWDFEVESFFETGYEWFSAGVFEGTSAWSLGMAESTYSYDTTPSFFERTTGYDFLSPEYTALTSWKTPSNLEALRSLEPHVAAYGALHLTAIAEAGIHVRVTEGYRTYERQDSYFKNGVSAARAGQSFHNFRLAYDIAVIDSRGRYVKEGSDYRYLRAGELGEQVGLKWGGRWKTPDAVHFELPGGRSISEVRREWEEQGLAR
jgi:RHS repeat-associated protein